MIIGQKGVKYGLTVKGPKTSAASKTLKPSVFEAGDSDDEHDNVEQQIARQQVRKQDDQKVLLDWKRARNMCWMFVSHAYALGEIRAGGSQQ